MASVVLFSSANSECFTAIAAAGAEVEGTAGADVEAASSRSCGRAWRGGEAAWARAERRARRDARVEGPPARVPQLESQGAQRPHRGAGEHSGAASQGRDRHGGAGAGAGRAQLHRAGLHRDGLHPACCCGWVAGRKAERAWGL